MGSNKSVEFDPTPMDTRWKKSYEGKSGFSVTAIPIRQKDDLTPPEKGTIRLVCLSDTHSTTGQFTFPAVPDGDILLHSGDFTMRGGVKEVQAFNTWLGTLPHRHKVVIAGNHEVTFDPRSRGGRFSKEEEMEMDNSGLDRMSHLLTNCIYLEDSSVELLGLTIYGSPWQPSFGRGWAFNLQRGAEDIRAKWAAIPAGVDVLLTHGPPLGVLDACEGGDRAGCEDMLGEVVGRVRPRVHLFGHIHEGYGMCTNGTTTFVNASTCTRHGYRPDNVPIVVDLAAKS